MPVFQSHDDTTMSYTDSGIGRPVVLLHSLGFSSALWHKMGFVDKLVDAGHRAICLDARGHGGSAAPLARNQYAHNAMARDVSTLLDQLSLAEADLVGYSMGSQIGLRALQVDARFRRAVLGGLGDRVLNGVGPMPEAMCSALESDPAGLPDAGRAFVERLRRWGNDPRALAAMMRTQYVSLDADLSTVAANVLLLIGDQDDSMGDPHALARALPDARVETVPATHITAMEHPQFAEAIVTFLGRG